MLVVAIIGLLAAIAVPKFANLVIKAKEAAVRGRLGSVRSALSIYYADNEGRYPNVTGFGDPLDPLVPRYITEIPNIEVPTQPEDHALGKRQFLGGPGALVGESLLGNTLMYFLRYDGVTGGQLLGEIRVGCTHTDTKGTVWSDY